MFDVSRAAVDGLKRIENLEIKSQGSSHLYSFRGAIIRIGDVWACWSPTVAAIALFESNNPTADYFAVNRAKMPDLAAWSIQVSKTGIATSDNLKLCCFASRSAKECRSRFRTRDCLLASAAPGRGDLVLLKDVTNGACYFYISK